MKGTRSPTRKIDSRLWLMPLASLLLCFLGFSLLMTGTAILSGAILLDAGVWLTLISILAILAMAFVNWFRVRADVASRSRLAIGHYQAKEFAKAREQWLGLLNRSDLQLRMKVLLWNNIAFADLLLLLDGRVVDDQSAPVAGALASDAQAFGPQELLREADEFSQSALQDADRLPQIKLSIRATRSSVLVELGHTEDGVAALHEIMGQHTTPQSKACCACFIALAEARRGNGDESKKNLAIARSLDPDCVCLDVVGRKVTQIQQLPQSS